MGSSIFREWREARGLAADLASLPAVNRAFGGSTAQDQLRDDIMDAIVFPHDPRVLVYYCGSNDLNEGESPRRIRDAFATWSEKALAAPSRKETKRAPASPLQIVFVSINRAPQKRPLWDALDETNRLVKAYCEARGDTHAFVDVNPALFEDGARMTVLKTSLFPRRRAALRAERRRIRGVGADRARRRVQGVGPGNRVGEAGRIEPGRILGEGRGPGGRPVPAAAIAVTRRGPDASLEKYESRNFAPMPGHHDIDRGRLPPPLATPLPRAPELLSPRVRSTPTMAAAAHASRRSGRSCSTRSPPRRGRRSGPGVSGPARAWIASRWARSPASAACPPAPPPSGRPRTRPRSSR